MAVPDPISRSISNRIPNKISDPISEKNTNSLSFEVSDLIRKDLHAISLDVSQYEWILSVASNDRGIGAILSSANEVRYVTTPWPSELASKVQQNRPLQAFLANGAILNALRVQGMLKESRRIVSLLTQNRARGKKAG